jgi:hypothetical protein
VVLEHRPYALAHDGMVIDYEAAQALLSSLSRPVAP